MILLLRPFHTHSQHAKEYRTTVQCVRLSVFRLSIKFYFYTCILVPYFASHHVVCSFLFFMKCKRISVFSNSNIWAIKNSVHYSVSVYFFIFVPYFRSEFFSVLFSAKYFTFSIHFKMLFSHETKLNSIVRSTSTTTDDCAPYRIQRNSKL